MNKKNLTIGILSTISLILIIIATLNYYAYLGASKEENSNELKIILKDNNVNYDLQELISQCKEECLPTDLKCEFIQSYYRTNIETGKEEEINNECRRYTVENGKQISLYNCGNLSCAVVE